MSDRSELREAALERAGGRCEFPTCTYQRPRLQMAHLLASGMGGSKFRDVLDNVAMLCEMHHDWLDGRITANGRRFENEAIIRAVLNREWEDRR